MNRSAGAACVERLVLEYGDRAFRFACRLTGDSQEAQDLVQEAYRKVLSKWELYDPDQPLEKWFFAILRHLYLDGVRRYENRHVASLDKTLSGPDGEHSSYAELLPEQEEGALAAMERRESAEIVRQALESLSLEHRTVLTLCDVERISYEQIAGVLGCPVGTVRSRVHRARDSLKRKVLEKSGWVP